MASTEAQIRNRLIDSLVSYAASIGITINPNDWILIPGSLSQTDYKLLLLNTVADAMAFEEQLNDLFQINQEKLISIAPPQTPAWIQNQFLNVFQWSATDTQVPLIIPPLFVPSYEDPNDDYKVIDFCSAVFQSNGSVLIRVAANSNGVPADLDTTVGAGALDSAKSFAFMCQSPGINYNVSSGKSDWLYLQLDVYFSGAYASTIFDSVKLAITTFLNNLSTLAFSNNAAAVFRISLLEKAILEIQGVQDVVFVNVAARPDLNSVNPSLTSFGTSAQQFLISNKTELQRKYDTYAGYISLENGTSSGTPSPVPYSQLDDARSSTDSTLNLNCIAI